MNWGNCNLREQNIHSSWKEFFNEQKKQTYFQELEQFLQQEQQTYCPDLQLYPPPNLVFNSLNQCPFEQVKIVLLGQDPYHNVGQAMGLSFSVPKDVKIPPSLKNIYKELQNDLGIKCPQDGDLTKWSQQGVLLLNSALTVRQHCPNSHAKYWTPFTDNLIKYLSDQGDIIFILWGGYAKKKKKLINTNKNHILEANHPSPLSCNRGGFWGCRHFSQCNQLLEKMNKKPIQWEL